MQNLLGQNLIPNGSFENGTYVNYIMNYNYWANNVPYWDHQCEMGQTGQYGTPDLFSTTYVKTSCQNAYKIPNNMWTINLPINTVGKRYAGFGTHESLTSVITNATGTPAPLAAGCYSLNFVAAKSQGTTQCNGSTAVLNTTTPKIEAVLRQSGTNMCASGITVFTSQSLTTGNWENLAGSFTITAAQAGIYDRIEFRILYPTTTYVFIDEISLVSNKPTVATNGLISIFSGQSAVLQAVGSPSGGTYLWNGGSTPTSATDIIPSPSYSSTYSVVYTLNGCPSDPVPVSVVVKPKATVTVNTTPPTICKGFSSTLTATSSLTGGSFLWSTGATSASIIVTPNSTTTYSVTYSIPHGCISDPATVTVTVNPIPTITSSTTSPICGGNTTTISAIGLPTGGTYSWNGSPAQSTGDLTVTTSSTTNYSVIYTLNGCSSLSSTSTVTVNPTPTVTASNASICSGSGATVILTATPSPFGGTYLWNTGATTASISVTPSSTTNYSVIYTGTNGCSSLPATSTVTVNPVPTVSASTATFCQTPGGAGYYTSTTATGIPSGGTYLWSTGATTATSPYTSGCSVTYTLQGCSGTAAPKSIGISLDWQVNPNVVSNCPSTPTYSTFVTILPSTVAYTWTQVGTSTVVGTSNPLVIAPPIGGASYHLVYNISGCIVTMNTPILSPLSCMGLYNTENHEDNSHNTRMMELGNTITVSPNPTTDRFTVEFNGVKADKVVIYNLVGKVVSETIVNEDSASQEIDLSDLPASVYLIQIHTDGEIILKRVIKN